MSKGLIIKTLLILAILLAMVAVRIFYLQRSHYVEAETHYAAGDLKLAVREYGTAMRLHFPFSPYTGKSADRLWRLGLEFEGEGELLRAQAAYSTLRSSFYATRSLYTPGKEWILKCEEKLASLRAAMLVKEGRISPGDFEAARLRHLEAMRTDRAPAPAWAALASLSFFGFIASVAYVIFRGFTPEARVKRREALVGAVAAACSFALWALSLIMA
jgi:hypothetical protein